MNEPTKRALDSAEVIVRMMEDAESSYGGSNLKAHEREALVRKIAEHLDGMDFT